LRRRLAERQFGTMVVAILLVHPVLSFVLILNDGEWLAIDLLVSLLLVLWALGLRLSGRLSIPAASLLLAINLVLPLLTLGWSQPFRETDMTAAMVSVAGVAANVVPAALLFVGLAAYDVLNFGVRYANVDGRVMPRGGRVLKYFGAVLLVTAFVLFSECPGGEHRSARRDPRAAHRHAVLQRPRVPGLALPGVDGFEASRKANRRRAPRCSRSGHRQLEFLAPCAA
jgi:hypothetical protein